MRLTAIVLTVGLMVAPRGIALAHHGPDDSGPPGLDSDHHHHGDDGDDDGDDGGGGFGGGARHCAAAKRALAGLKFAGLTRCDAQATANGTAVDAGCVSDVKSHFAHLWAKVEKRGGCVTTGDETTIENKVDSADGALVGELKVGPPPSHCSAKKFQDAGKKGACELFCAARAALHGTAVDPGCESACAAKFMAAFQRDEKHPDCHTRGDAATVESAIDAFVADVVAELPFSGTTTTTVPTTTSTSTTAPTVTTSSTTTTSTPTTSTTSTTVAVPTTTTTSTSTTSTTVVVPSTTTTSTTVIVPTTSTTSTSTTSTTSTTLGSPSAAFLDDPHGG